MNNAYDNYIRELSIEELRAEARRQRAMLGISKENRLQLRAFNKWILCNNRIFRYEKKEMAKARKALRDE